MFTYALGTLSLIGTLVVAQACMPGSDRQGLSSNLDRSGWASYGGDPGGSRYSSLDQINRDNVELLRLAWTYSSGEMSHDEGDTPETTGCANCHTGDTKFEATPILADGRLYVSTPWNKIIAIDPGSGTELWRFDPHLETGISRSEGFISRGVSYWADSEAPPSSPMSPRPGPWRRQRERPRQERFRQPR